MILFDRPDSATKPGVPVVWGVDRDLLLENDRVKLDGTTGQVDLLGVESVEVVTSFLERSDGRILLLRRSEQVGSFRNRWAGISGFLERQVPRVQAVREIEEECGVRRSDLRLVREGELIYARDEKRVFVVHPFRFRTEHVRIRLDWEHTEFRWIRPSELGRFETVPKLERAWASVSPEAGARQR